MDCLIHPGATVSCHARLSGAPFWMNKTRLKFSLAGRDRMPPRPRQPTPEDAERPPRRSAPPDRPPSYWTSNGMDVETRCIDFRSHPTRNEDLGECDAEHSSLKKDAGRLGRPASGKASNAGISDLRFRPIPRKRRHRAVRSIRRDRWREPGRSSRRRRRLH